MSSLASKIVPVIYMIGAGPGVGTEVASLFASKGFSLGLVSRTQSTVDTSASTILSTIPSSSTPPVIHTATADGADTSSFVPALESLSAKFAAETSNGATYKPVVLVYNIASLGKHNSALTPRPIETVELDAMYTHFTISVASAFVCAQWAAKNLAKDTPYKPALLFTGGGLGVRPFPQLAGLGAAKAALRNLGYSYHAALKPQGIHAANVMIMAPLIPGSEKYTPELVAKEFWKIYEEGGKDESEKWAEEVLY